jgi:hypothetical protein
MSDESDKCVVISDGRSSVILTPVGPPAAGIPTRVDMVAGPFRGSVLDETAEGYERFHRELVALHESRAGTAQLTSLEGHFSLVLTVLPHGAISVNVAAVGSYVPRIRLEFEFEIDQAYLPAIIARIEQTFLDDKHRTRS